MAELFDSYEKSYHAVVQSSIDFSGLPHSFFVTAKADILRDLIATRLDSRHKAAAVDVGCGVGAFHPFMRGVFWRLCGTDVSAASVAQARNERVEADPNEGVMALRIRHRPAHEGERREGELRDLVGPQKRRIENAARNHIDEYGR